jgi:hypothetical protein
LRQGEPQLEAELSVGYPVLGPGLEFEPLWLLAFGDVNAAAQC